jgi:hypothetical protein
MTAWLVNNELETVEGSGRGIITYYPANYLSEKNDKNKRHETDPMNTKATLLRIGP